MRIVTRRPHSRASRLVLFVAVAAFILAPAAYAQPPQETTSSSSSSNGEQQPAPSRPAPSPFWAPIAGSEWDTHGTGYAFIGPSYVHPIRPGLAWTARVFGNYLAYRFDDGTGEMQVRSPGISSGFGLRFGDESYFQVLAGPEVKWHTERLKDLGSVIREETRTRLGANFGAELYTNPTSHNNVHGILNYNTSDQYTWGRLAFKEQVSNLAWRGPVATFVGAEGVGQGNQDIRSMQLGGFFEVLLVPSSTSVMFRSGYKRSMFDVGPDKTGPYFAVGFYQRLK